MALNTRKFQVDNQVKISQDTLQKLQAKYDTKHIQSELLSAINNVKKNEEIFLSALGAKTIEEVNSRLNNIRESMGFINNLNGANLREIFLEGVQLSYEEKIQKEQDEFVATFTNLSGADTNFVDSKAFQAWFQEVLNSADGFSGRISGAKGYVNATAVEQVVFKKLSEAQKRRAKYFMEKHKGTSKITVETTNKSVTTTLQQTNWSSLTLGLKQKELEEMLAQNQITQDQVLSILQRLETYILLQSGGKGNLLFESAVKEVLYENQSLNKVFYGGNIVNGITGLLGEIQGLFYIKTLLNDPKARPDAKVQWTGGINNPHEDLILLLGKKGTGIQIKNSAKELDKLNQLKVTFASRQASSFANLEQQLGEYYENIIEIYNMYAFNIEYIRKDGKYVKGPNSEFKPTRDNILNLRSQVDQVMAMFAASLMYMAIEQPVEEVASGNSIYLLGGKIFVLASEILTNLFNQLENSERLDFYITSHFNKGASEVGNIVDYLNSKTKTRGGSKSRAAGTLFLQSSYNFNI